MKVNKIKEAFDAFLEKKVVPLDKKIIIALFALIIILPTAAFYFLHYTAKTEEIKRLESRETQLRKEITEAKKIAALAEVHYAQLAPHMYCGPIVGAANIQLATCSPNFLILEGIESWRGFQSELLEQAVQWEDGYVIPSSEPGLGVSLNEDVARANPWTGGELHLQMGLKPVR